MANEALLQEWIAIYERKHGVKPTNEIVAAMREQIDRIPELKPGTGPHAKLAYTGPPRPKFITRQEMIQWHNDRAKRRAEEIRQSKERRRKQRGE